MVNRHPLEQRLTALHRRVRRLVLLHGLGWAVAAGLAAALILGWIDYLLRFHDRGLRIMATLGLVVAWLWACRRYLVVAWRQRLDHVQLAVRVQQRFPQLGDRLASAVEFLHQAKDDPTAGAPALRQAVIDEAVACVEPLDFSDVLDPRPSHRAVLAMIGVGLLVALLAVLHPAVAKVAAARLLNPLGDTAWPRTTWIELRKPVTHVGRSQPFEVEATDARGKPLPPVVRIHYRIERPDGTTGVETDVMRPLGEARVARRENIQHPFAYRIEGGDDQTMPWISVAVIEPPALVSLSVRAIPPAYTGWPPYDAQRQVRALVGTHLEFSARSTKSIESASLCFDDRRIAAQVTNDIDLRVPAATAEPLVVEKSSSYWFSLTDREGLTVASAERGEIRAAVDSPPSVSIEQPSTNLFVTPRAVVPLRMVVKDDLAVHHVDLVIARSDRPQAEPLRVAIYQGPDQPAPPSGSSNPATMPAGESRTLSHIWDLDSHELQPGVELTIHAEAADYLPATGRSEPRRIHVITPEELQDRLSARQSLILAELDRVLKMQQESRNQVEALATQVSQSGRLKQVDLDHLQGAALGQRQVDRMLTSQTDGVPMHILALLADLDNNRIDSSDLRRHVESILAELDRLEKNHLPRVGQDLTTAIKAGQIALQESSEPKEPSGATGSLLTRAGDALAEAGKHQEQVIDAIRQLLARLGQWDSYRRFHRDVARLLRDQDDVALRTATLGRQTLTRDLKDLLPQQQADLRILARQQLELALRLDQLREEMREAGDPLRSTDPLAADTLADAVAEIQRRAIGGHMHAVEDNIENNRMGQAVQGQRQIVDDLREVVDRLAGRREHELTQIARKLDDLHADVEIIARRQAQVRDRLRREVAERLRDEQTRVEADTRTLAQWLNRLSADRAGQGASRAADLMAQTAAACAQGDASAAGQRAEEAQAQLADVARELETQRRQVDSQLSAERRSQLRQIIQQHVKEQESLYRQTQRLDTALQSQGRFNSSQSVALADLARRQHALQTQTQTLADRQPDSDPFGIAIGGAASDMGRAADQLDQRYSGQPAQQAQQDALRRLAITLDASTSKPSPAGNDPADNGRAGQGGARLDSQSLPQLRLIKLLQEEINTRTRHIERAGSAIDAEVRGRFAALSQEQGRLADATQKVSASLEQNSSNQKPSPAPKAVSPSKPKTDDLPPGLMGELGTAAISEDDQPLSLIVRKMRHVEQRVVQADAGSQTQETQREIVVGLNSLIGEAQQRSGETIVQKRTSPGTSQTPPQSSTASQAGSAPGPAKTSALGDGSGEKKPLDPRQVHDIQRQFWGELPEKSREILFQSPVEEFLPAYESLIEQYYRRLADEKANP
jgi:hypothetical protein